MTDVKGPPNGDGGDKVGRDEVPENDSAKELENLPLDQVPPRVRKFLSPVHGGSESASKESGARRVGPPNEFDEKVIAGQLRRLTRRGRAARSGVDPDVFSDRLAKTLVSQARKAMVRLAGGASDSSLTLNETAALEAVLHTRGRPALRVEGDRIEAITDEAHPGSSFWMPFLQKHEPAIVDATAATGAVHVRLDSGESFVQGTAWLIKNDLVVTNRHVLFPANGERLARRIDEKPLTARMKSGLTVSIDFGFDDGPPGRRLICPVLEVPFVSAEADPIDVAVLRIDPKPLGAALTPLKVSARAFDLDQLYIIGHPGSLLEVPSEVNAVFGTPDERKRVSFGELMDSDATRPNEHIHDASTIGGYSGGCVLGFGFGEREVVGLHHFGSTASGNRAFKSTALLAHPVAPFLR